MKTMNDLGRRLGLLAALMLGACASMDNPLNAPSAGVASPGDASSGYGVVQSIELVKQENHGIAGTGIGLGTIAGAVVGGVVGNQVGSGKGNTAATVIGAAGGAYVDHELESRQQPKADAYKVTVRMADGSYQALMQATASSLRVGDRVRVANGVLQRY